MIKPLPEGGGFFIGVTPLLAKSYFSSLRPNHRALCEIFKILGIPVSFCEVAWFLYGYKLSMSE
jgi:hypothetical protein